MNLMKWLLPGLLLLVVAAGCSNCGGCSQAPITPPANPELAQLEQRWQANPADDEIAGQLAAAYRDAGRTADARRLFGEALRLDPADAEWLAQAKALDADFAPVIAKLQRDIASDSRDDEARGNLGRILLALGQPGEAQPHLLQALQLNPGSASWADLLRDSGYDTRQLAAAIAAAGPDSSPRTAVTVSGSPDDDEYWGNLAKARRAAGDGAGALAALERAHTLDPEDQEWEELRAAWRAAAPR